MCRFFIFSLVENKTTLSFKSYLKKNLSSKTQVLYLHNVNAVPLYKVLSKKKRNFVNVLLVSTLHNATTTTVSHIDTVNGDISTLRYKMKYFYKKWIRFI